MRSEPHLHFRNLPFGYLETHEKAPPRMNRRLLKHCFDGLVLTTSKRCFVTWNCAILDPWPFSTTQFVVSLPSLAFTMAIIYLQGVHVFGWFDSSLTSSCVSREVALLWADQIRSMFFVILSRAVFPFTVFLISESTIICMKVVYWVLIILQEFLLNFVSCWNFFDYTLLC